jgi:hypothetical protein
MAKANGAPAPHQISLSKACERLASALFLLPVYAREDEPSMALYSVKEINSLLDAATKPIEERGDVFASVGSVGDVITVCGKTYPSAHVAAFREASHFARIFWFHVDREGKEDIGAQVRAAYAKRGSQLPGDVWQKDQNGTGLNPNARAGAG